MGLIVGHMKALGVDNAAPVLEYMTWTTTRWEEICTQILHNLKHKSLILGDFKSTIPDCSQLVVSVSPP